MTDIRIFTQSRPKRDTFCKSQIKSNIRIGNFSNLVVRNGWKCTILLTSFKNMNLLPYITSISSSSLKFLSAKIGAAVPTKAKITL